MTLVELKRKDGKPLYCRPAAVTVWMESTENSDYCVAWIGGKEFTLGETVEEVTKKLLEA
jgi:hypothetical protein